MTRVSKAADHNHDPNHPQLAALKIHYDPTNLIRLNVNVRPEVRST